jgi:DNA polymerase III delta prime subunit
MLLAASPAVCARAVDHRPTTRLGLHAVQEADKALAQAKQQQQSAAEDLMAVRARAQEDNKAAEDEAHKLRLAAAAARAARDIAVQQAEQLNLETALARER